MAIRILREGTGSRTPGYLVAAGQQIVGGMAVMLSDANTITAFTAVNGALVNPLGLAIDSNVLFAAQNASPDQTAGPGYDYLNYDRGGLISVLNKGAEVEVYDDGRSVSPFDVTNHTFVLNAAIYTVAGYLSHVVGSGIRIGRVTSVAGTYQPALGGGDLVVRFILEI